jgi:hypothetical protein
VNEQKRNGWERKERKGLEGREGRKSARVGWGETFFFAVADGFVGVAMLFSSLTIFSPIATKASLPSRSSSSLPLSHLAISVLIPRFLFSLRLPLTKV